MVISNEDNNAKLYNITQNDELEYLNSFSYPSKIDFPKKTENFTINSLYFIYHIDNREYLSIRNDTFPYTEICNNELSVNNYNEEGLTFLSNDRAILYHYSNGLFNYKLCKYVYPDSFELLNNYTTPQNFHYNNKIIYGIKDIIYNTVHYYIWVNDEIEEVYSYDFGYPIIGNIFLPEENKLIAFGLSEINLYNCEYVTVENNQISNTYPINISNYPNPFNPSTTISFTLKEKGHKNKIAIYNLKGEKVKELIPTNCKIGKNTITWDGKNNNGKKVASGVYLYSLIQDGKAIVTKKMVMVK